MDIWVCQVWWGDLSIHQVDLGDWTIEQLVETFPNSIYFYAELVTV